MNQLLPFQEVGVRFLASRTKALLADEQGLGKTIQAIEAINVLNARKVLIVCKASGKFVWQRELAKWLKLRLKIQVLSGRQSVVEADTDVVVVNYDLTVSETVLKQLIRLRFAVVIFDEAHYLKTRSSRRTKAALLKGGIASRGFYKWFLTGTPILNRPVEVYPLLRSVAPEVMDPYLTYEAYARHFCGGFYDGFQFVAKGATNTAELNARLVKNFMLRRLKKDHLKELPDKQYQIIDVEAVDAETKKLIEREFTWSKQDVAYQKDLATGGAEISLLRHEMGRKKVKPAVQHLKDMLDENEKIVVFAYHKDVIAGLFAELKDFGVVVFDGSTPADKRGAIVDQFQTDPKTRVFLGQYQAAGDTITLTAASVVVFVESSWVPGEIDQATDRLHRIGQKDAVLVQFLVFGKSLDEHQLRTVVDKKNTIGQIVDARPEEYILT